MIFFFNLFFWFHQKVALAKDPQISQEVGPSTEESVSQVLYP
jgi:hypothetical protein